MHRLWQSALVPVAVVLGAARGIGSATAELLAAQGWDLAIGDICRDDPELGYSLGTAAELAATTKMCASKGVTVVSQECDVRSIEQVQALVGRAREIGSVTACVFVAGVLGGSGRAWELEDDIVNRDLQVNYLGLINAARACVDTLIESGPDSRFVAVLSAASHRGLPLLASYAGSKHAALGYLRSLAIDLAPFGVTANGVSPGSTDTDLLKATGQAYDLEDVQQFSGNQRMGRLLEPREIASAVAWLVSPAASGISGSVINVDGMFSG